MSNADFLGRAIETVKKAIETDTAGEYEKAYQMYYSAREYRRGQRNGCMLT
jgi:vacuolar protein-sorting-associated protein 4